MNKKWLATSLCAATLFATSITAANAADINKEENKGANTQHIQLIKGDHYQELALKLIKQISVKGEFGILSKDAINKALVNIDTNKIVKEGKVVNTQKLLLIKKHKKKRLLKQWKKRIKHLKLKHQ